MDVRARCSVCIICGKADRLLTCSRCGIVSYCGKEHQKKHWKLHKLDCNSKTRDISHQMTMCSSHAGLPEQHRHVHMSSRNQQGMHRAETQSAQILNRHRGVGSDMLTDISIALQDNNDSDQANSFNLCSHINQGGSCPQRSPNILKVPCPHHKAAEAVTALSDDFLATRAFSVPESELESSTSTINMLNAHPIISVLPTMDDEDYISNDRLASLAVKVTIDLNQHGICVIDNFLGHEHGLEVLQETLNLHKDGQLQPGQVVSKSFQGTDKIRGDQITWVEGVEEKCSEIHRLISSMDYVMLHCGKALSPQIINGRTKAMVACYPGGGSGYVRHVDNPNADGRCITSIYYLNRDWDVRKKGGLLRIYPEGKNFVANIEPLFDRLLLFWSDRRNPHEVQPAYDVRYAITVWYFDAKERALAKERFRMTGLSDKETEGSNGFRS